MFYRTIFILLFLAITFCTGTSLEVKATQTDPVPSTLSEVDTPSTTDHLSYTKYGWRNVDYWTQRPENKIGIEYVHPIIWSALLVFGVLMVAIWSSHEDELVWD